MLALQRCAAIRVFVVYVLSSMRKSWDIDPPMEFARLQAEEIGTCPHLDRRASSLPIHGKGYVVARICLDEIVRAAFLTIIAHKKIGFCEDRGVKSGFAFVPLTRDKNPFCLKFDLFFAISQIPRQSGRHDTRASDSHEWLWNPVWRVVTSGGFVRPIFGVGISYRL
jgi:hypothetical protein